MLLFAFVTISCIFVQVQSVVPDLADQPVGKEKKIQDLVARLLGGEKAVNFQIKIDKSRRHPGGDIVKVTKKAENDRVQIVGSSGTAAAYGLNHYLKHHLNCHVSWDGDQLNIPEKKKMPLVEYELVILDRFRYYMNVCTYGYSYVWWNWTRWERELDWMALNGFNLALAFTGAEAVWREVYLELGYTQDDINNFFSGPAFLPWNRMGNIRGTWTGAVLSTKWHENQVALQRKILRRMRSLGITPVLPGFSGFLPRATSRLFPNATINYANRWNGFEDKFCCPAMLLPTDPLFLRVGSMFVKRLTKMFGTNHLYSADPFNEMVPSTKDVNVIRQYGQSLYGAMAEADPQAIWVLQGWFLNNEAWWWSAERAKAFLTSVAIGKIIVLDLQAELAPQYSRTQSFYGQPFIWCMLHNFGGTLGLQGAAKRTTRLLDEARKANSSMIGVGITMEGIGTNYVIYDYFTDLIISMPREKWFENYAARRYGEKNPDASAAWEALSNTVYNYDDWYSLHGNYIFNNRPSLTKKAQNWFEPSKFFEAWRSMLRAATTLSTLNELFVIDVVDVTREALRLKMDAIYLDVVDAYRKKDLARINAGSAKFLRILDDLDMVLSSTKKFMLGFWLENAKAMGSTPQEKLAYERDARNQISMWGPNQEILDYSNKQWAGVIKDYFKPRWLSFFKLMKQSVAQKTKFDSGKLHEECSNIEKRFAMGQTLYPTSPLGNTKHMALDIFKRWVKIPSP